MGIIEGRIGNELYLNDRYHLIFCAFVQPKYSDFSAV